MTKDAFLSAIFIVLFWCAFFAAIVGGALDLFHLHGVASVLWRVTGISVLLDGVILWICK